MKSILSIIISIVDYESFEFWAKAILQTHPLACIKAIWWCLGLSSIKKLFHKIALDMLNTFKAILHIGYPPRHITLA